MVVMPGHERTLGHGFEREIVLDEVFVDLVVPFKDPLHPEADQFSPFSPSDSHHPRKKARRESRRTWL